MNSIVARALVAGLSVLSTLPMEAPAVKHKETVNFANLVASVTRPYVAPGKVKEYSLYGPWIEYASSVMIDGVAQTIVERRPFASSDGGLLKVKLTVPPGTGRGVRTARINIACTPFTDCISSTSFEVMVLGLGTLSSITPNSGVAPNTSNTFTISGTNLDNATVFTFRTDLNAVSLVSNSANSLVFRGTTTSCGTNRVIVRDVAEGGDFYPFPGGLDIRLSNSCDGSRLPAATTISAVSTPGPPDLVPLSGGQVLRHIAANRKLSAEMFCNNLFAQPTTALVRTITVGDVTFGVGNSSSTSVTTPFRVQLLRAGTVVADSVVQSLAPGASKTFTYRRAQSQTQVARLAQVPNDLTRQTYNATGADCVQTIGQQPQFDWQDPQYQVVVDPARAVTAETNRSNNNRTF